MNPVSVLLWWSVVKSGKYAAKKHTFQNHSGHQSHFHVLLYILRILVLQINFNLYSWKVRELQVWMYCKVKHFQTSLESWCQVVFLTWINVWCWFHKVKTLTWICKISIFSTYILVEYYIANTHQNITYLLWLELIYYMVAYEWWGAQTGCSALWALLDTNICSCITWTQDLTPVIS